MTGSTGTAAQDRSQCSPSSPHFSNLWAKGAASRISGGFRDAAGVCGSRSSPIPAFARPDLPFGGAPVGCSDLAGSGGRQSPPGVGEGVIVGTGARHGNLDVPNRELQARPCPRRRQSQGAGPDPGRGHGLDSGPNGRRHSTCALTAAAGALLSAGVDEASQQVGQREPHRRLKQRRRPEAAETAAAHRTGSFRK